MRTNETKRRLREGGSVIGVGASFGSVLSAEALAMTGFDFVLIDNQHGPWTDDSNLLAFRAISAGGATPFIRVQQNDYYTIGRALDRGALGIIVPMVNSAAEAAEAARAVRYPPQGGRSIGPFGTAFLGDNYTAEINQQVYLAVQIESATAVERAEEILAVEGVDGCWTGPADLAASMGTQMGTPEHEDAIMKVLEACHKTGKVPGIAGVPSDAQSWLDKGFRFVTIGGEAGLLAARAKQVLDGLKRA